MHMPVCRSCSQYFPFRVTINGKQHNLRNRTLCFQCNPFKSGLRGGKTPRGNTSNCICDRCGKGYVFRARCGYTRKKCSSCSTNIRRKQRRQQAVEYKGGQCVRCGYNRSLAAFDFHHRDETTKVFEINGNYTRAWGVLKAELDKCDLLCSNCHREIHDGL